MDFWLMGVIGVSGTVVVGMAAWEIRRKWRERKLLREHVHPWGEPLKQVPPNIGGEGHPPYAGPNYVDQADMPDYLRPIPHYGKMSLAEVAQGDLAWEFESGRVAPDGTIWLTPGSRAAFGVCTVPTHEAPKAARFGWCAVDGSQHHGYIEVRRDHVPIDPDHYRKD